MKILTLITMNSPVSMLFPICHYLKIEYGHIKIQKQEKPLLKINLLRFSWNATKH